MNAKFFSNGNSITIGSLDWQCDNQHLTLLTNNSLEISIYTLGDLGELSSLVSSLSRTIQQYLHCTSSEWIMCGFGVFPIFFREQSFKSRKILGLTLFRRQKL